MPFVLHSHAVLKGGKVIRFQSNGKVEEGETLLPVIADPDPPLGGNERLSGPDYEVMKDRVRAYGRAVPMTPDEIAERDAMFPQVITRRQCALQLLATQTITPEEALAMTKAGDVPAAIAAIFDSAVANSTMTADQRILAEIDFAAANYYRSNSLLPLMGLTEAEIDQFFIAAVQL